MRRAQPRRQQQPLALRGALSGPFIDALNESERVTREAFWRV